MQRTVSILSFMYFSHVCAIFALEQFHFSADTSFNLVSRVREYELVVFLRLYFDKTTNGLVKRDLRFQYDDSAAA